MAAEGGGDAPSRPPGCQGCALQLVQLNMAERRVEINEDALERLGRRLRELGTSRLVVVSVMGAFRTGKSFLLDLILRYLRHEDAAAAAGLAEELVSPPRPRPPRGLGEPFGLPAWFTAGGHAVEGGEERQDDGFKFRGGMDPCTEGIWVWSEPFVRQVGGRPVALLLLDTQGAWDGNMTKEQSATVFGLTALLSSKLIYNIDRQIQEDKVENLAYFMGFAQAALRKAAQTAEGHCQEEVERPFQSLDFLVRDWANFEDEWSIEQCRQQMAVHLDRHLNPEHLVERGTVEGLRQMFAHIGCFCLPHPGLRIARSAWTGRASDLDRDFLRFVDEYMHDVFSQGLNPKTVLGSELTTVSFPLVLRTFVEAFHHATPSTMSFTQAMTAATVLLAKEQAMVGYSRQMDDAAAKAPRGREPSEFEAYHSDVVEQVRRGFTEVTILGSDATRAEAWASIENDLRMLQRRYAEDNLRRLEQVLNAFANITLLGIWLFLLDRASDWTCDWWSETCCSMSRVMCAAYVPIFVYVAYHVYRLVEARGRLAAVSASAELWKEMLRLTGVYGDLLFALRASDLPALARRAAACLLDGGPGRAHAPAPGLAGARAGGPTGAPGAGGGAPARAPAAGGALAAATVAGTPTPIRAGGVPPSAASGGPRVRGGAARKEED